MADVGTVGGFGDSLTTLYICDVAQARYIHVNNTDVHLTLEIASLIS